MPSMDELIALKQRVEAEYLARPGVTGVDVGYKEVGGVLTDQLAIRVHVKKKRADVPKAQLVPAEIEGVATDVLERVYEAQVLRQELDVSALADTTHYSTVEGGVSIGPSRVIGGSIYAGTLGAIVVDKATGKRAALTNFHVACVDTGWHVGDRQVQPSRIDTGVVPGDEFGAIARATLSGHVDGAVISLDPGRATDASVVGIGKLKGTKAPTLGTAVRKRGRTTGLTYGSVDGLSLSVNVNYGPGLGTRTFTNQVSIASDTTRNPMFSDHGDSGSAIVDASGYVVALLFAGSGAGTVGNPISDVMAELNVDIAVQPSKPFKEIKDRKEIVKEFIKDRKEFVKELRKDLPDNKRLKDVRDIMVPPWDPRGPIEFDPARPGPGGRLSELEQRLAALESFISPELRPDLSASALGSETDLSAEELEALRGAAARQSEEAAQVKTELDTPWS